MKVLLATLALAAVCGFTHGKSLDAGAESGLEKASRALKAVDTLLHLTRAHGISKIGNSDPENRDEYEMPKLEEEMCGKWGLGGAFWEAYALVNESDIADAECPAVGEFIWTLVDRVPYVLCFMAPEERRVGFECVATYAGQEGAPDVITKLKAFIDFVMVFVEPYLP